ncbi:MAG: glycosyltransferase family 4 protein [Chitinophagaceae bacterium]
MKITYTAPNRSHHYPYAEALHRAGYLHAFISGFSRFSPRAALPGVGDKLKRHDFFQNLYLASLKFNTGPFISSKFNHLTNLSLDKASYKSAKESDAFIFYRTEGYTTTQRLKKEKSKTVCIMEEVNSHVDHQYAILQEEYVKLGLGNYPEKIPDHATRLKAYEISDYILCPSEFVRQSFIDKGFSPKRLLKVNFGFSATSPVANKSFNTESFRVLYVGQLNFRKGLRYAIEAFKQVKHPNKEFIIVGPKVGITGLEKMQLPKEVVFTGTLKGEELNDQYRKADVFILPSLEEGLALVQMEALSFGVPVLITTNTGGEDIITDGGQGFIVPPADANALKERLQEMAGDKELLKRMSEEALQAAHSYGSWDLAVKRLADLLIPIIHPDKIYNARYDSVYK